MKKLLLGALFALSFSAVAAVNDYLACQVVYPENVANPDVAIVYDQEFSNQMLTEYQLQAAGFNMVLWARNFTSADPMSDEGVDYLLLSDSAYSASLKLVGMEAWLYVPNNETGELQYVVGMGPMDGGTIVYVFGPEIFDNPNAEPVALLACEQGTK